MGVFILIIVFMWAVVLPLNLIAISLMRNSQRKSFREAWNEGKERGDRWSLKIKELFKDK